MSVRQYSPRPGTFATFGVLARRQEHPPGGATYGNVEH